MYSYQSLCMNITIHMLPGQSINIEGENKTMNCSLCPTVANSATLIYNLFMIIGDEIYMRLLY